MKLGDRVVTKYGEGVVVDSEFYSRVDGGITRWGLKLDANPFEHAVAYFWPDEISPLVSPIPTPNTKGET